jgi:hypothetical protein
MAITMAATTRSTLLTRDITAPECQMQNYATRREINVVLTTKI